MPQCVTALIKPASSLCNMNCSYCFYKQLASSRKCCSYGIMSQETAAALIRETLSYADGGPVTYCFQGGEPLLAGISFFQDFTETVRRLNTKNSSISYSVQTNGLLIDDAFCRLFREKAFLLGVSLDGKEKTHDRYRKDSSGHGTFQQVTANIELLKSYGIPFNILSVVTKASAAEIIASWNFFRARDYRYLQFIPCLNPLLQESSYPEICSGPEYFDFQRKLFDLYLEDRLRGRQVSVRHLDNLLLLLQGHPVEQCDMIGRCLGQLVAEADGSIYPCDFYCTDEYLLGNINNASLRELEASPNMKRFREQSLTADGECLKCPVWGLCRGGCRREREQTGTEALGTKTLGKNIYCEGRRLFYRYVQDRFRQFHG